MFKVNKDERTLWVYDDIGAAYMGMIDAGMIVNGLELIGGDNRALMRINSRGGSTMEMVAIANAARRHPAGVDVAVDGIAGSAAHYITLGVWREDEATRGKVTIAKNAAIMLHRASAGVFGTAKELRKAADDLEVIESTFIGDFMDKTGKTEVEILSILDKESWLTAEMAVEMGFADEIGLAIVSDSAIESSKTMTMQVLQSGFRSQEIQRGETPPQTAAKIRAYLAGVV